MHVRHGQRELAGRRLIFIWAIAACAGECDLVSNICAQHGTDALALVDSLVRTCI